MNKKKFFLIAFIFVFNFIYSEEASFLIMGNLQGKYENLDVLETIYQQKLSEDKGFITINTGNNLSEYKSKNEVFNKFFQKFDFNFLAKQEYLAKEDLEKNLNYSSLNIIENNILPYRLVKVGNRVIVIAGITNIYEEDIDLRTDYKRELRKLIYKMEEKADAIIIISDLERSENIKILREFNEISFIIESGKEYILESYVSVGNSYIVPCVNTIDLKLEFELEAINKKNKNALLKRMNLYSYENISDYSKYIPNYEFSDLIEWTKIRIRRERSSVYGYNNTDFYVSEVNFSDSIQFLEDISDMLMKEYESDLVFYPAEFVKKGLKKGLYTKMELENLFTNDYLIEFELTAEELENFEKIIEKNKGNKSYVYIGGKNKKEKKDKYKVISVEMINKNYSLFFKDKKIKSKKISLFDFLTGR